MCQRMKAVIGGGDGHHDPGAGYGILACAFGYGVEQDMERVGDHFLSVQRGLFPPSRAPTSTSAAAAPGESDAPAELVGGAAGRFVPLVATSSSTMAAATPGGSGLPAEPVGGATGRSTMSVDVKTPAAAVPGGSVPSAALAGRMAGQPASPDGVLGGGDMSGGGGPSWSAAREGRDSAQDQRRAHPRPHATEPGRAYRQFPINEYQ